MLSAAVQKRLKGDEYYLNQIVNTISKNKGNGYKDLQKPKATTTILRVYDCQKCDFLARKYIPYSHRDL